MGRIEVEPGEMSLFPDVEIPDHASAVDLRMPGLLHQGKEFLSLPEETGKGSLEVDMGIPYRTESAPLTRGQELSGGNAIEEHPGEHHGKQFPFRKGNCFP